jgi:hypothetical protein
MEIWIILNKYMDKKEIWDWRRIFLFTYLKSVFNYSMYENMRQRIWVYIDPILKGNALTIEQYNLPLIIL